MASSDEIVVITTGQLRAIVREENERFQESLLRLLATPRPHQRERLTVKEAAEELRCSPRTIRDMVTQGRLRAVRTGLGGSNRLLILRESLDEALEDA